MIERANIRLQLTARPEGCPDLQISYLDSRELATFDLTQFHHVTAAPLGLFAFRAKDGAWVEKPLAGCGLGNRSISILQALQLHPGIYLSPTAIAELTGNDGYYDASAIASRIRILRRAHDEDGTHQRFLLSRRVGGYALAWADYSWLWVDQVAA